MSFGLSSTDPIWLLLSILGSAVFGAATLAFGRKLPRHGDWLVGLGLAGQLAALALSWSHHLDTGMKPDDWLLGWIWPRGEAVAVTVGILRDTLGLALSAWTVIIAALLVSSRALISREKRPERVYAAIAIASAGVALACVALTAWLAFVGLALAVLAGLLAIGSRWTTESEAELAARFARERGVGLLFCMLGATAIASGGGVLAWSPAGTPWAPQALNWVGAGFLAIGLFLHLQPLPLLGLAVMPSSLVPAARVPLNFVFPALAAFLICIRLEPQLRQIGLFPAFGWVALVSAALSTVNGLLQKDWRLGLNSWSSSALSVALAALSFAGTSAGLELFLSAATASVAFALLASSAAAPEEGSAPSEGNGDRAGWVKLGILLAAACGSGVVGFVSASGAIGWLTSGISEPAFAASFAFTLFLLALAGWKLAWATNRGIERAMMSWAAVACPYLALIAGLGVVWVGTLSGGALPGSPDLVLTSAMEAFFGHRDQPAELDFLSASWIHWGALVLAVSTAYWTAARKAVAWDRMHEAFPKTAAFLSGSYGFDTIMDRGIAAVRWAGSKVQAGLDQKSWGGWIPRVLGISIQWLGRAVAAVDRGISVRLDRTVRRGTEVPAKVLQLIQSGDVQWYLFFAIGSGIAILVHFLRF